MLPQQPNTTEAFLPAITEGPTAASSLALAWETLIPSPISVDYGAWIVRDRKLKFGFKFPAATPIAKERTIDLPRGKMKEIVYFYDLASLILTMLPSIFQPFYSSVMTWPVG